MGICVGVDVAKEHLDWVLGPKAKVKRIPNTKEAVQALIRGLHGLEFDRVILESTGQYERLLFEAFGDEGIPVVRMNPVRVRRFGDLRRRSERWRALHRRSDQPGFRRRIDDLPAERNSQHLRRRPYD